MNRKCIGKSLVVLGILFRERNEPKQLFFLPSDEYS